MNLYIIYVGMATFAADEKGIIDALEEDMTT